MTDRTEKAVMKNNEISVASEELKFSGFASEALQEVVDRDTEQFLNEILAKEENKSINEAVEEKKKPESSRVERPVERLIKSK